MGLGIRIPHTKDSGLLSLRVVLDFLIEGNAFSVDIGDSGTIKGLPLTSDQKDLQPVYDQLFAYTKGVFANPVDYFAAERSGKIGFLPA